jgi:hypothetical protein
LQYYSLTLPYDRMSHYPGDAARYVKGCEHNIELAPACSLVYYIQ